MQDYFTSVVPGSQLLTKIDIGMLPIVWRYYTYFNLVFVVFGAFIYKYYNILLGSLITVIGSTFIFYVSPGYMKINTAKQGPYAIYDWHKYAFFDFMLHILPLLIAWWVYGKFYKKNKWYVGTWVTLVATVLFFMICDPRDVYDVSLYTMTVIGCIVLSVYICI